MNQQNIGMIIKNIIFLMKENNVLYKKTKKLNLF